MIGILIETALRQVPFGTVLVGLIASTLIAQRSLYQHVARVRSAFAEGGLAEARQAVSMIVGRDPEQLDEAGVCRAAIESCAENFSDGVVAPVFWLALLGLPGLIAYKAINTADSMIGHRSARHQDFGWAAARLDDLVNLIPARLSGLLLVALVAPIVGRRDRDRASRSCGAMPQSIARPMPAGRKARWPARSAWRWRGRGATRERSRRRSLSQRRGAQGRDAG